MEKHRKAITVALFIGAIVFYIFAMLSLLGEDTRNAGVVCMGLGSTCLCLGAIYINRSSKADYSDKDEGPNSND